jgi:hypothetical protein
MERENFITSFGLRWRRDATGWSDHRSRSDGLFGRSSQRPSRIANQWDQHGAYVLYEGHRVEYVGIATRLGNRIRDHCFDRHEKHWDRFSWFGSSELVSASDGSRLLVASAPELPEKPGRDPQTVIPWRVWSDIEALIYRSLYPYRHIDGMPGKEPYFGARGVEKWVQVSEATATRRRGA